jgi:hypothetical protein
MKILRPEEVTVFPEFREFSPEEMKEAYALAKAAFTIEDLLRFTEIVEEVPAEDVLAELEESQRKADQRTA